MTSNTETQTTNNNNDQNTHLQLAADDDYKVVDIELWSIYFKLVQENDTLRGQRRELEQEICRLERKVDQLRPCCLVRNCCKLKYWLTRAFCPCLFNKNRGIDILDECCNDCGKVCSHVGRRGRRENRAKFNEPQRNQIL